MEELRNTIWDSMLDIDMNSRYYGYLCQNYEKKEKILKILLAITTSTSIASWKLWNQSVLWLNLSIVWQILTALSAIIAIILPLINYSKKSQKLAILKYFYSILLVDYERLWLTLNRENAVIDTIQKEYLILREKEASYSLEEAYVKNDIELIKKCQNEVENSRGFT